MDTGHMAGRVLLMVTTGSPDATTAVVGCVAITGGAGGSRRMTASACSSCHVEVFVERSARRASHMRMHECVAPLRRIRRALSQSASAAPSVATPTM